eukprot:RCo035942
MGLVYFSSSHSPTQFCVVLTDVLGFLPLLRFLVTGPSPAFFSVHPIIHTSVVCSMRWISAFLAAGAKVNRDVPFCVPSGKQNSPCGPAESLSPSPFLVSCFVEFGLFVLDGFLL